MKVFKKRSSGEEKTLNIKTSHDIISTINFQTNLDQNNQDSLS